MNFNPDGEDEDSWDSGMDDKEKEGYYPTRDEITEDARMLRKHKPGWAGYGGYGYGGYHGGAGGKGGKKEEGKGEEKKEEAKEEGGEEAAPAEADAGGMPPELDPSQAAA